MSAFAVLAALLVPRPAAAARLGRASGGVTNIVLWHGYVDAEGKAMKARSREFNATHPKIHVTAQFYGNSDYALQKVLTSIARRQPPRHRLPVRLVGARTSPRAPRRST